MQSVAPAASSALHNCCCVTGSKIQPTHQSVGYTVVNSAIPPDPASPASFGVRMGAKVYNHILRNVMRISMPFFSPTSCDVSARILCVMNPRLLRSSSTYPLPVRGSSQCIERASYTAFAWDCFTSVYKRDSALRGPWVSTDGFYQFRAPVLCGSNDHPIISSPPTKFVSS